MKTGSAAVDLAVDWLRDCKFLFVLTGAGVSKESGIRLSVTRSKVFGPTTIQRSWLRRRDSKTIHHLFGNGMIRAVKR